MKTARKSRANKIRVMSKTNKAVNGVPGFFYNKIFYNALIIT